MIGLGAAFCLFVAMFCICILPRTVYDPNFHPTQTQNPNIIAYNSGEIPLQTMRSLDTVVDYSSSSSVTDTHRQRSNLTKRLKDVV